MQNIKSKMIGDVKMGKTCVICGAPSGMYPLCIKHLKEKADGKVVKCATCNTWHEVDKPCGCDKTTCPQSITADTNKESNTSLTSSYDNCIVCGKTNKNPYYPQCIDCFDETKDFISTLNKNSTIREFRDYYYNLKGSITLMRDKATIRKNCNKLIAIATANEKNTGDTSLTDRFKKDIKDLTTSKTAIEKEYSE